MSKKYNWLYLHFTKSKDGHFRTEVNEIESLAFFAFEEDHIEAFVTKDEIKLSGASSGVLIDGFDDEDVLPSPVQGRKKRDIGEEENSQATGDVNKCRARCLSMRIGWTGPVLDQENKEASLSSDHQHWNSFIVQRATSNGRCVRDCLNGK